MGLIPILKAFSALINNSAAAPSATPELFPAVMVPALAKAGSSLAKVSAVAPNLGFSSVAQIFGSPAVWATSTGTISSLKRPEVVAASAL